MIMIKRLFKDGIVSGNQLKMIALLSMTLDHVGFYIFPHITWLRIAGRLAFPVFAYMIAEGCKFTSDRKKYLLKLAVFAFACQVAAFIGSGSLYQCIFVTFSMSVAVVYSIDYAVCKRSYKAYTVMFCTLAAVYFLTVILPDILYMTNYKVDYGFFGVMLPVAVYFSKGKLYKLLSAAVVLILISLGAWWVQWYSLISLILLSIYNGKRGKVNMKNLFYIYYPLHLSIIYFISIIKRT